MLIMVLLLDFSAGPLAGATIEDFDPNQRIRLRNIIQNKPGGEKNLLGLQDDELDKALRLTTEVDGKIYPTVTGMLLIGKESSIEKLMPTAKASFQVLEGTKVRVNIETSGPLLEVFEKFETYVDALIKPSRKAALSNSGIAVLNKPYSISRSGFHASTYVSNFSNTSNKGPLVSIFTLTFVPSKT